MNKTLAMICALAAMVAWAEKQPYERYQSIVDRQMFGPLPPNFDPTKPPSAVSAREQKELTKEQETLQSAIHFSVIRVSPEGDTQVGFTDNSDPKSPRHYFLREGETSDGWTVKAASAADETMTIEKDGVEVSLKIGDNSGKGGGKTERAGADRAAAGRPAARFGSNGLGRGLLGGGSLRERRLNRQRQSAAEQAAREEAERAREAEREAKAEQEKAEREEERAQQRQQLMAIQEELKRAREARQKEESEPAKESGGEDDNS